MEYMRIERSVSRLNNCAVTLGKFDGIHRGHRKLMDKILSGKETGVHAVVLAFVSTENSSYKFRAQRFSGTHGSRYPAEVVR